jgi:hypothetical protein
MIATIGKYKNLLIAVAVIAVLFIGYSLLFSNDDAPLTAQEVSTSNPVEQELLGLLLELRSIELNAALFGDARFESLRDFSQQIVAEPVGRQNPFAPFGQ